MSKHDHMEEYFRDRAENYDYPFEEKDWEALEARLDHELPTSGSNFWGQVLIGILVVSLPWWPWSIEATSTPEANNTQETEQTLESSPTPESTSIHLNDSTSSRSKMAGTENSEEATPTLATETDSAPNENSELVAVSPSEEPTSSSPTRVGEETTQTETKPTENQYSTPATNLVQEEPTSSDAAKPVLINATSESNTNIEVANSEVVSENPTEENELTETATPEISEEVNNEPTDSSSSEPEDEVEPEEFVTDSDESFIINPQTEDPLKKWRPFVAAGLEIGGTQMDNNPRSGWRAGLGIRYQPIQEFSISAALFYGDIGYTAYGDEYYMDPQYLQYSYELTWTDGTCEMLELPIEVRYHPLSWLNAGIGLRSYFVMKQEYDLYFESPYYPSFKYPYTLTEGADVWMAHLKLSLGFDIPIGKYDLELQPFYQMPLKGIGRGSVEWKSAGLTALFLF